MNFRSFFCCCCSPCFSNQPAKDKPLLNLDPDPKLVAKILPITPQASGQSTPVNIPSRFTPSSQSSQQRLGL